MTKSKGKSDLPHELKGKLAAFDSALTTVEKRFQPLLDIPQIELNATVCQFSILRLILVTDNQDIYCCYTHPLQLFISFHVISVIGFKDIHGNIVFGIPMAGE